MYILAAVLQLRFMAHVDCCVLYRQHFPQCACVCVCVCSAKYGCYLWFLEFVPSWNVAQAFSELFSDGSDCPRCNWYPFVSVFHMLCISTVRCLYFRTFPTSLPNTFLSPHITSVSWHVPFFIITDYDVRFTVRHGSVTCSSHNTVGYLTFRTCFD